MLNPEEFLHPPFKVYAHKRQGHLTDGMQGVTQMTGVYMFLKNKNTAVLLHVALFISTTCDILLHTMGLTSAATSERLIPVCLLYSSSCIECGCDSSAVDSAEVQWVCGRETLQTSQGDLI